MDQSARDSRPPHHEFALELERARREAGLQTKDLASKLFLDPRTVRRYLNGERLPTIETTEAWERVCNIDRGRLSALHPAVASSRGGSRRETGAASAVEKAGPGESAGASAGLQERRRRVLPALGIVATSVVMGAVLLTSGGDKDRLGDGRQGRPTGVAYHRFTKNYVGDVWIRIVPTRDHGGEPHHVTLRWGPFTQEVELNKLDRSRALFTGKRHPDNTTLQVNVKPAATISFGEGDVPAGALNINRGWTKSGLDARPSR